MLVLVDDHRLESKLDFPIRGRGRILEFGFLGVGGVVGTVCLLQDCHVWRVAIEDLIEVIGWFSVFAVSIQRKRLKRV